MTPQIIQEISMTNNDTLRRVRYIFDYDDSQMLAVFAQADHAVSREQLSNWLKKDEDPDYNACADPDLARFLNGFIIEKRGKKDGPQAKSEERLSNNMVFLKLKIALDLQAEDVLSLLQRAEMSISKHELSAFFRKPGHKNYRECKDQVLRNFLAGLQLKYRPGSSEDFTQTETPDQLEP
ncbi:MAG: hypothetical protein ACI9DC_000794 [Gammaproteobacteria bacterium]|jgi:uncharacterized protein YehS (DUF1456 family)